MFSLYCSVGKTNAYGVRFKASVVGEPPIRAAHVVWRLTHFFDGEFFRKCSRRESEDVSLTTQSDTFPSAHLRPCDREREPVARPARNALPKDAWFRLDVDALDAVSTGRLRAVKAALRRVDQVLRAEVLGRHRKRGQPCADRVYASSIAGING